MIGPDTLAKVGKEWVPQRGQTRYYVDNWANMIGLRPGAIPPAKVKAVKVWIGGSDLRVHIDHAEGLFLDDDITEAVERAIEEAYAGAPADKASEDPRETIAKTFEEVCRVYNDAEGEARDRIGIIVATYERVLGSWEAGA